MIDVTDTTFEHDVMELSDKVPVVVDLWAPWCGPCRQLGPMIEEVVAATGGKVELVKVNVDENPQISARFQVKSIPAVYALRDRKIVDGFIGAQDRRTLEAFVARLTPTEADTLVNSGDEASLRRALILDPDHVGAVQSLAVLLIERGDYEEALELLGRVPETSEIRQLAARARLGEAHLSAGEDGSATPPIEEVLDGLLSRLPGDDEARQQIVDILETMDPSDTRVATYRRAMSSRLF